MVNTYAVQSGGCRFESLWGFVFFLKGAHYEVDYSGKKTYLAGLQCTLTSSCAKTELQLNQLKHKQLPPQIDFAILQNNSSTPVHHHSAQASFAAFRGIRDTKIERSRGIQDKISL